MRLALISFEYPPAVAIGGIGTYAWQASRMLAEAGDDVVVFAAGVSDSVEHPMPRVTVHRIAATARPEFAFALVPVLRTEHARHAFDVVEAPEIGPEGLPAFEALPELARVVKLHTPTYWVNRIGYEPPTRRQQLRVILGALRRGRWQRVRPPVYAPADDAERRGALLADEIAAPSRAIAELLMREWTLDPARVHTFPLPFEPPSALLDLPVPTQTRTIGFLGRLEPRKGVVEMARAIPTILRSAPHLSFRFIGPSWSYHGGDMRQWMERRLHAFRSRLHFTGAVAPRDIPAELAQCDVLVLPSRWENFPFACWEAMASGRAVIASSAGGMAEVIEPGISGLLVRPRSSRAIADAVVELAQSTLRVASLGSAGRARVQALLSPARVYPLQRAGYERAKAAAHRRRSINVAPSLA
ncbi:glycosyltransferase family 4 protein [Opitutus terrae]|uniref:Glycosyl transferase group 1 n=1 Tax=Opitutus terrae (strain DSM 11246 / JCM 15787 / PB90-1) TaxID=452637 RepID=B1ZW33_OPITP|nr:glycosyltransferase family 4 protein [Opitutus terrae]ACB76047.1 glycosyl transferase group 1 [Opitutus terrae PB90-1]